MGAVIRYNTVLEKEKIFVRSASFIPSAYRTAWNHDAVSDLILQICLAVVFDISDRFYRIEK